MANSNWKNKWVLMLLAGIIIQAIVYPVVGLFSLFTHEYFAEVILICIASVGVQAIGFFVIMGKTRGMDPAIYGQGRPFQHKLREEDEEEATRKPTFD
ncbi:MAG: hypothetical protein RTV31_07965 [Candidatus Thorarchaeota archaeon]